MRERSKTGSLRGFALALAAVLVVAGCQGEGGPPAVPLSEKGANLRKAIFKYVDRVNPSNAEIFDVSVDLCSNFDIGDFRELGGDTSNFGYRVISEKSYDYEVGDEILSLSRKTSFFHMVEFIATRNENSGHCRAFVKSIPLVP